MSPIPRPHTPRDSGAFGSKCQLRVWRYTLLLTSQRQHDCVLMACAQLERCMRARPADTCPPVRFAGAFGEPQAGSGDAVDPQRQHGGAPGGGRGPAGLPEAAGVDIRGGTQGVGPQAALAGRAAPAEPAQHARPVGADAGLQVRVGPPYWPLIGLHHIGPALERSAISFLKQHGCRKRWSLDLLRVALVAPTARTPETWVELSASAPCRHADVVTWLLQQGANPMLFDSIHSRVGIIAMGTLPCRGFWQPRCVASRPARCH